MIKLNKTDKQFMANAIEKCKKIYIDSYESILKKVEKDYLEAQILIATLKHSIDKVSTDKYGKIIKSAEELEIARKDMLAEIDAKHQKNLNKCDLAYRYVNTELDEVVLTLAEADCIAKLFRGELIDAIDWFNDAMKKEEKNFSDLSNAKNAMVESKFFNDIDEKLFNMAEEKHERNISQIK